VDFRSGPPVLPPFGLDEWTDLLGFIPDY